jgi:membrane protease YdiL (CAAX protease family)
MTVPPPAIPDRSRDGVIRWWDVPIAFFGGNLVGIALAVVLAIGALIVAIAIGREADTESTLRSAGTSFWINHAAIVVTDIGLFGTVWFVASRRMAHPIAHYFSPTGVMPVVWAALSGIAMSLLLNGGDELLARSGLVRFEDTAADRALVPHDPAQILATVFVVGLFAPFVEEFFFRGLFLDWLKRAAGTATAVIVTALCFAVVHGHFVLHPGLQGVIYTVELTVAGLVLAWWVVATGSLRTSLATHAAYNVTAIAFSILLP